MVRMHRARRNSTPQLLGLSPTVAGTLCCATAALSYTMASICMRQLSALRCDEMWAICNKELVTVLAAGPWLLVAACRGRRVLPSWRTVAALLLVGLAVQLAGNLASQWAYGKVGLAIVIAANVGTTLIASALMGRLFLGERVSLRSAGALAMLLGSLGLLAMGAEAAGRQVSPASDAWLIAAAVAAACGAGVVYAVLSITIRHTVTRTTRVSVLVFAITLMGVVSLGPLSVYRLGVEHLLQTPPEHFALMYAAGTFNLIGFLAITKGLQLTTVVHANVLNASQVALAAVAGVLYFCEPANPWLLLGIGLTILGLIVIDRPSDAAETV